MKDGDSSLIMSVSDIKDDDALLFTIVYGSDDISKGRICVMIAALSVKLINGPRILIGILGQNKIYIGM